MYLIRQLEEAAERLDMASAQVAEMQSRTCDSEERLEWLTALSDMVLAVSDIQALTNESMGEQLQAMAARLGVKAAP